MPRHIAMSNTTRINLKIAAIYTAAATGLGSAGGYYYNANIDEWREQAAEEQREETAIAELAQYLPLVRQMTQAIPNAKYPPGPVSGGGMLSFASNMTLEQALSKAEHAIQNKESFYRDDACALVSYLREVHKIATRGYEESKLSLGEIDIKAHREAAAAADEASPVCGYNGYELNLIHEDGGLRADELMKRANDELSYLALKARFANSGAPAHVMRPEDRAKIIETAISLAENPRGTVNDNCNALLALREATLDAYAAHQSGNTGKTLPEDLVSRSDHTAKSCTAFMNAVP